MVSPRQLLDVLLRLAPEAGAAALVPASARGGLPGGARSGVLARWGGSDLAASAPRARYWATVNTPGVTCLACHPGATGEFREERQRAPQGDATPGEAEEASGRTGLDDCDGEASMRLPLSWTRTDGTRALAALVVALGAGAAAAGEEPATVQAAGAQPPGLLLAGIALAGTLAVGGAAVLWAKMMERAAPAIGRSHSARH